MLGVCFHLTVFDQGFDGTTSSGIEDSSVRGSSRFFFCVFRLHYDQCLLTCVYVILLVNSCFVFHSKEAI